MTIDTNTMISITEANQNFSKVARVVDEHGTAVILKNNVPRYLVIDFSKALSKHSGKGGTALFWIGKKSCIAGRKQKTWYACYVSFSCIEWI